MNVVYPTKVSVMNGNLPIGNVPIQTLSYIARDIS